MDEDQNIQLPASTAAPAANNDKSDKEIKLLPAASLLQTSPHTSQNQKPETDMEVHKHPHHVLHKKKWFEYLLEFLMIFLAVFLGFFAENIRERNTDKERFVTQMGNVIGILKSDIQRFGEIVWYNDFICKGLDSFRLEIDKAIAGKVNPNKLYYYHWKYRRAWFDVIPNVAAMSQLQNSGLLRLIGNDTLVYWMCFYHESLPAFINNQRAEVIKCQDKLQETYKMFFDLHGFEELVKKDSLINWENDLLYNYYHTGILHRNPPLKLLSTDPKELKRLYMDLTLYETEVHHFNSWIRSCLDAASRLRKFILMEYNLRAGKVQATYSSVGVVGSATAKGWDTSIPMRRAGSDMHQWQDTIKLSVGDVKFRADNKWDVNWGNSFFPASIAIPNGTDIPISTAGTYVVTFNDITWDYTFTLISKSYP